MKGRRYKNKRPYLGCHLDKPSCNQSTLEKLLVVLRWANFYFFNDGCLRMLLCFLHRDEATCFCASCFFNCTSHSRFAAPFRRTVKACPRPSGLTSDWTIRFGVNSPGSGNYRGCFEGLPENDVGISCAYQWSRDSELRTELTIARMA